MPVKQSFETDLLVPVKVWTNDIDEASSSQIPALSKWVGAKSNKWIEESAAMQTLTRLLMRFAKLASQPDLPR